MTYSRYKKILTALKAENLSKEQNPKFQRGLNIMFKGSTMSSEILGQAAIGAPENRFNNFRQEYGSKWDNFIERLGILLEVGE